MQIGIIGMGKMGYNLALNMKESGHEVVAFNRSPEKVREIEKFGVQAAYTLKELVNTLKRVRVMWLMIPAGKPVDDMLDELTELIDEGDVIIDGGNSNYKDTIRRYELLKRKSIRCADVGTSGGMSGARYGACTMVGAEDEVFQLIEPVLRDICVAGGYLHTGAVGSGHYVKMVHNGIEYGMMQAIGEGFEILKKSDFNLNLKEIAGLWNHGSVIRSWLIELTQSALEKDESLENIKGVMYSSGEGLWTVEEALKLKVPVPIIASSLFMRYRSEQEDTFTGKVVAALRNEFGGHAVKNYMN